MDYDRQQSLGGLINVVAFHVRQAFERELQRYGLDISVWPVLVCLWEMDGIPQGQIAEHLGVPGYAMSRGVDRLERAGLVRREVDAASRRVRRVFLTESGRHIKATLSPLAAETNRRVLAPLSTEEQETLRCLLRKLVAAL